jgi:hypothetical protein
MLLEDDNDFAQKEKSQSTFKILSPYAFSTFQFDTDIGTSTSKRLLAALLMEKRGLAVWVSE